MVSFSFERNILVVTCHTMYMLKSYIGKVRSVLRIHQYLFRMYKLIVFIDFSSVNNKIDVRLIVYTLKS